MPSIFQHAISSTIHAVANAANNLLNGLYYDFTHPLSVVETLLGIAHAQAAAPGSPVPVPPSGPREWYSQPRLSTDTTGEVVNIGFKLPLSIGHVSFQILRMPCQVNAYYLDTHGNWLPLPDASYNPVQARISFSAVTSWYKYETNVYPIIATGFQLRIVRTPSTQMGNNPYVVGIKEILIQQDVFTLHDTMLALPSQQDIMGNTITSYVRAWDANNVLDNDPATFWRSFPCPDPNGVVALYLDTRDSGGAPQLIDTVFLDPVYTGNQLNLYYSNDPTQGTSILSPVPLAASYQINSTWTQGVGMVDTSGSDTSGSQILFPTRFGPFINQPIWVGIEWTPNFDPGDAPGENPILFAVKPGLNAVQTIQFTNNPTGGYAKLSYGGYNTGNIFYDETAAALESALEALASIGAGNVIVEGPNGGPWNVTFVNALGLQPITTLGVDANNLTTGKPGIFVIVNTTTQVTVTIDGTVTSGYFYLSWDNHNTSPQSWTVDGADVQLALEHLPNIGTGNVTVTGNGGGPWTISFAGTMVHEDITGLTATSGFEGSGPADIPPGVVVETVTPGVEPPHMGGNIFWPTIYYDIGASAVTLEFTNGADTSSYSATISPTPSSNVPLEVVCGWSYDPTAVFISVTYQNGAAEVANHIFSPAGPEDSSGDNPPTDLPANITLDGQVGYLNFAGKMTALVVKQETWDKGQVPFQQNSTIYANPSQVRPDSSGKFPSTSLDNAILSVDWTSMRLPVGGTEESWYESKVWTPIYANYTTQKGFLYLPQKTSMSYLKLEMTRLTPEPYPVYDQGINVTYDTFPASVYSTVNYTRPGGLGGIVEHALVLGAQLLSRTIGTVNWFNPSTIRNAINHTFGQVTQNIQVVTGPGTISASLPNSLQANIANSYRSEQSNPWIYSRPPPGASQLAGAFITGLQNAVTSGSQGVQTDVGAVSNSIQGLISSPVRAIQSGFSPIVETVTSNVTPILGADWWLLPGHNLKLPAALMRALTGTKVNTNRPPAGTTTLRFQTTSVQRYATNTVELDAAVAYFAGIAEVQTYVTHYIDALDPPCFTWTQYDPVTFIYNNINQLVTGPVTTAGSPFRIENPDFVRPFTLDPWSHTGPWSWNATSGLGEQGDEPCAAVAADGHDYALVSAPVAVNPGDELVISALVGFKDLTSTTGGKISISGIAYDSGTPTPVDFTIPSPFTTATVSHVDTLALMLSSGADIGSLYTVTADPDPANNKTYFLNASPASDIANWIVVPATYTVDDQGDMLALDDPPQGSVCVITAGLNAGTYCLSQTPGTVLTNWIESSQVNYTVSDRTAMLALSATPGQYCTINDTDYQGTYLLVQSPASTFSNWRITGYGPILLHPVRSPDGDLFIKLTGTYTVPGSGVDHLALSLNVDSGITGGTVFWTRARMDPPLGSVGSISIDLVTTSTFDNVAVNVFDSGLLNSDSLWARTDPNDANISNLRLAPYVDTYPPALLPPGDWDDSVASWDDADIRWGEPLAVVNISVDPTLIFQGQRTIHFTTGTNGLTEFGYAGITLIQQLNMGPNSMARLGCVYLKPNPNGNQVTLQLIRLVDGVVVHAETFSPAVGYWTGYQGEFFELPNDTSQVYQLQFLVSGDAADEMYLADVYTDIAGIRYLMELGGPTTFDFDITPIVYGGHANVSCTIPVNEITMTVLIVNENCWAYGAQLTPRYLK